MSTELSCPVTVRGGLQITGFDGMNSAQKTAAYADTYVGLRHMIIIKINTIGRHAATIAEDKVGKSQKPSPLSADLASTICLR